MTIPAQHITEDPRWALVESRDAGADGSFVYTVLTTGIYCRPSCPSRQARPENVAFYDSPKAAEKAGYRACKRCKPNELSVDQQQAAIVARLCRALEAPDDLPDSRRLAELSGWSLYHMQRTFKKITGLTPKAYAAAFRAKQLRAMLKPGTSITRTAHNAGYSHNSQFYQQSAKVLGMKPKHYRAGGTDAEIYFALAQCSLGAILVAQSQIGICAISIADDPESLINDIQQRFPNAQLIGADTAFEQTVAQVINLVEQPGSNHNLPLDIQGTAFQRRVWEVLQHIPPGTTLSYAEVAERIGSPKAARAVAQACAANTLAVAVPCHRVVRNDGSICGYRWGVERKKSLLEREKAGS